MSVLAYSILRYLELYYDNETPFSASGLRVSCVVTRDIYNRTVVHEYA